mgnify:CR=1 FL=1
MEIKKLPPTKAKCQAMVMLNFKLTTALGVRLGGQVCDPSPARTLS